MNLVDVIQFDGNPSVLVWKSPIEDFNSATQLIVDETHEAIVMIEGRTEVYGPGTHTLQTMNIPGLNFIQRMATGGETPFPCKVFFVNKVHAMDMLWGTRDTLPVMDPELDIMLHLRLRGNLSFVVENTKKFVQKFVGFVNVFDDSQVIDQFRGIIATEVTDQVAKVVVNAKIGLFSINAHLREISDMLLKGPLQPLFDEYGAKLVKFNLETITSDNEDTAEFQQAKSAAKARVIAAGSEAEARRLQGYTWSEEQQAAVLRTLAGNNGAAGTFIGGMLGIGTAGAMAAPMNNMIGDFMGNGMGNGGLGGAAQGSPLAAAAAGTPLGGAPVPNAGTPAAAASSAPAANAPVANAPVPNATNAGGAQTAMTNAANAMGAAANAMAGGAPKPPAPPMPPAPGHAANAPAPTRPQAGHPCPGCGHEVQAGWVACPFCGTRLGNPKCPSCGQEVQAAWMACPFCGTKLR